MSLRSSNSLTHENRMQRNRVSDDDLFDYALRVAILSYLVIPKSESPKVPNVQDNREREHHSRLAALSNFSMADMFRDIKDGSKSVKFPEKMLKVLEQKLQDIAMGKDPAFSDQLVRRTMGKFYGQFMVDSFKRQMKENRKIEELILMFASHATPVLRKEPSLADEGWKLELNNQIAHFIKLLRSCLRNVNHVSPELISRLDTYSAKLAPTLTQSVPLGDDPAATGPSSSHRIADMRLVKIVGNLFKIPDQALQSEVDRICESVVSEKAAMADLKACLKNINANTAFPGRREDFDSDAAYQSWRTRETTDLQQLVLAMAELNPELAKSSSDSASHHTSNLSRAGSLYSQYESGGSAARHSSIGSRRSFYGDLNENGNDMGGDDDPSVEYNFTFIPPNPKKFYKRLVEYSLIFDLDALLSRDDNEQVSLFILSPPHLELIGECATRWRISHTYRAACFLDIVRQFFERNDVPLDCVPEALNSVIKVTDEIPLSQWSLSDVEYLANIYGGLVTLFLSLLYHAMDTVPNLKQSELNSFLPVLEHVRESKLVARFDIDIEARLNDVREKILSVSAEWYEMSMQEKQKAPGVNRALPLLLMTDDIEKSTSGLDKRFPKPLLGKLDIVSYFVEVVVPRLIDDLQTSQKKLFEASMNGPTPDVPIQDIFALYRRTLTLVNMYKAFVRDTIPFGFQVTVFFEPYVRQWLVNTDNTTKNWVEAAISQDKFEAEGAEGHSSSIVDLFDSLRSPINFLQDLEWEDEYQEARFATSIAKTISKAVDQYCRSIESLFLNEMFPRPTEYLQLQKSSAWLEKARQLATTGEKRVEPFNFDPKSCVKLNNVEAARQLLDKMYNQMQADKVVEVLQRSAPPVPAKKERDGFLFSVKVVIAEGLVPLDSSPNSKLDTFVTLSDEAGTRLAKTRTIYENLSPRWDETFDLSVDKPLWVMVSVRDRALIGKHDIVGRAYLCLDPRRFSDLLAHDLWMDLDTQGRILVRVSMEGEKDDIQFHFGRAFRSLKRAETDMLRIFVDKMSPFVQQCLSRNVVKSLIKSRDQVIDYNKALGGVTALYRSALGSSTSEPQIPLPSIEKPRVRPEELTDVEIEEAILPLFDYLDRNLQTLNTYLSEMAKDMVMTRVWKEILMIIEGLLIPPLSDIASDMKPLKDKEVDIVFRWLKFLKDYFYANGEGPISQEVLNNQKYNDVVSIRLYYDWDTDSLMEECVAKMKVKFGASPSIKKRAKSVYSQRNLGTIKKRKTEKKQEADSASASSSEQVIMRILRMRPGTREFITQQLEAITKAPANQVVETIPQVPPLP